MGTAESIIAAVDKNLGHKKGKMEQAHAFFKDKQNLRDVWAELDMDRSHHITLYEIRLHCQHKADVGLHPWRYLGGMNDKAMRAAFRKTCDLLNIDDGQIPKRGLTKLLKNIWLFSTFWEIFEKCDLNRDEKIDRIEFNYMCKLFELKPKHNEFDLALEFTESDKKFGLGYFSFCQYALHKVRNRRRRDEELEEDNEEDDNQKNEEEEEQEDDDEFGKE